MVESVCLNCEKYIFDAQNVTLKRMSLSEYIEGVYRKLRRTNATTDQLINEIGVSILCRVNKSECELCGAPHAVFSLEDGKAVAVKFFFSGSDKPSEQDLHFIEEFRRNLLS